MKNGQENLLQKINERSKEVSEMESKDLLERYVRRRISMYETQKEGALEVTDLPVRDEEFYFEELMRRLYEIRPL